MASITFEEHEFEYDPAQAKSYKNIKKLTMSKKDPTAFFEVAEVIFEGRDEEYAEILGNDFDKFGQLVGAVFNEVDSAKN